ncbi:MAG: 3-phosphoshikimate 1-carboxyvinyltransferase [Bacilli bacterium]|nr:3-phosphoshikimate 1-carboxyvinyltransferase [Bacilli bacterium]
MNKRILISSVNGKVLAPPSKSYAHRILISSALSKHDTTIDNVELSNDIIATLNCLKALGTSYEYDHKLKSLKLSNNLVKSDLFDCIESGSTLRFMIPIAIVENGKATFTGTKRLMERGIGIYEEIFNEQGIKYSKDETSIKVEGKLNPGSYKVLGNVSSQFISGLLFSLPLLNGDSLIEIIPPIESIDYILITIDVLSRFGIKIKNDLVNNRLFIKGNQKYLGINSVVEGDYSNAAFLDAFNYLGGNVYVDGLNELSLQGDKAYIKYFKTLKEFDMPTLDISNTIDLGPILFVMASLLNGAKFVGTKRLQIKESDRVKCVCDELVKFGVEYEIGDNYCIIKKSNLHKPTCMISSHNDHRLVMAFTVMLSKFGGVIENTEAVNKSFPTFFKVVRKLGIEVQDE